MGPTSYMRSVVDRNVVMRRIPAFRKEKRNFLASSKDVLILEGKEAM